MDLLVRRHALSVETAARVLAAPFWSDAPRIQPEEAKTMEALRITYGGLLLNGPFTVIIAREGEMIGLTDRIRLRPLVVASSGPRVYLSSEESAIRLVDPEIDEAWIPVGGHPVVARRGHVPTLEEQWPASEVSSVAD